MAVFENCSVLLELKNLLFKEKKKLKSAITDNGGSICFVVNKQCSLIVTSDVSNLSTNRLRSIQKYQTPVVGEDYVYSSLDRGVLLPVDDYKLDTSSPPVLSSLLPVFSAEQSSLSHQVAKITLIKAFAEQSKGPAKPVDSASLTQKAETPKRSRTILEKFRIYNENDSDLPTYPDNFQVAKYSIFEKTPNKAWCVLELQSFRGEKEWLYRVVRHWKNIIGAKKAAVRDMLVFLSSSEEALEVYKALRENLLGTGLQLRSDILPLGWDLGSAPLRQLLLEEKLSTGSLSQEVGVFVELLWTEALGCLSNILRVSVDKLSLNDVSRVEGLLLQAQRKLRVENHAEVASLLDEVYTLLPLREHLPPSAKLISQTLDLCQLIRDVLNVSEMTLRNPMPSCVGKYRALRCSIEAVPPSSSEFQDVAALVQDSMIQIQQIVCVCRGVELQTFKSDLGNIKPLLHSSSPSNFVGVLSRGLLLPRVGVEHHGIERTDLGKLGSGIYFSDAVSTCLKYSKPSTTDGSRLLLVCDVALGRCKDVHKRVSTLTQAPEGHHSVRGVRRTPSTHSEFEDDEYVVYSPDQVKLKYVVQFSINGDQLKEFSPDIITTAEPCLPSSEQELGSEENGVEMFKNPLDDVKAGLLDSSGQQLPLQAIHVKCKLKDLLSQVVIFQKYTNLSSVPIEAKYVFPLSDSAAVCAFEAFINGKHVVGQVKEKETARKEYKQAIEKGHGAYLMDQDAPDVFTISVGNLPPAATVLIKVTFLSELIVRDGRILFSLPGRVAPWLESAALNQTTQVTVEKVCVTESANTREFTLDASVEMPYEISILNCITHKIKIKRTDCKAVVSVLPGQAMGPEGFQLSVTLSEVHLPRMWVEKHPVKDSEACMLVFYPKFDVSSSSASNEVVLLLDTSESMKGESLRLAQRIALQVLKTLDHKLRLNVILFGTDHTEAFLTAQPLVEAHQAAESFIKRLSPVGGSTELWRPLRALSLLPPSQGVRNLLLLSDGHIQNAELTLKLIRDNTQHSRLFTCGLSTTANRHMLRTLAQAGGGAFEFFDTKTKHNWAEKVACQVKRMASPCCSSVSVKWQQFSPKAPLPVQAPKQLHGLFNDCHTLVYGFVPHCFQATLLGNLSGQELKTMVSTSELLKTRGTFLHKFTAKALIRDYEDGCLDISEAEHEGKKVEMKQFIIEMSKEFSVLSQFTSFVAIEERDSEEAEGFTDIPNLVLEEDVDFLPYISWIQHGSEEEEEESHSDSSDETVTGYSMELDVSQGEMEDILEFVRVENDKVYEDEEMITECSFVKPDSASPDSSATSVSSSSEEDMELLDSAEWSHYSFQRETAKVSPPLSPLIIRRHSKAPFTSIFLQPQPTSYSGPHTSILPPPPRPTGGFIPTSVCPPPPPPPPLTLEYPQGLATPLPPPPPPTGGFIPTSVCPPPPPPLTLAYPQGLATPLPPPPTGGFIPTSVCPPPPPPLTLAYPQGLATPLPPPPPPTGGFIPTSVCPPPPPPLTLAYPQGLATPLPPPPPPTGGFIPTSVCPPPPPPLTLAYPQGLATSLPPPRPPALEYLRTSFIATRRRALKISADPVPPPPPPALDLIQTSSCLLPPRPITLSAAPAPPPPPPSVPFPPDSFGRLRVYDDVSQSVDEQGSSKDFGRQVSQEIQRKRVQTQRGIRCSMREIKGPTPLRVGGKPQLDDESHDLESIPSVIYGSITCPIGSSPVDPSVPAQHQQQQQQMSGFGFSGLKASTESLEASKAPSPMERGTAGLVGVSFKKKKLTADVLKGTTSPPWESAPGGGGLFGARRRALPLKSLRSLQLQQRSDAVGQKLKWTTIFHMQHSEGYWELTTDLGDFLNVDVDVFANVFLKSKGICSLGVRAHADILRLVATLLVLQLMRMEKLEEGKLLRTLFCLNDSSPPRPERWEEVNKAVVWVCWADREYPCIYSRLEFGLSWESSTRQLLGFEGVPPFSRLTGLKLQRTNPF